MGKELDIKELEEKQLGPREKQTVESDVAVLQNIYNQGKGIKRLWANIYKAQNDTAGKLRDAEDRLIKEIGILSKGLYNIKGKKLEEYIQATKSEKKDDPYVNMINDIFRDGIGTANKPEKAAKNFLDYYPRWCLQLADSLAKSNHYKRISTSTTEEKVKIDIFDVEKAIDNTKKFFNRKEKEKPTTKLGKVGAWFSSIGKAMKAFRRMRVSGKASKTGTQKQVDAFFKLENELWRRWWEIVCPKGNTLSKDTAKSFLKGALKEKNIDIAKKYVLNLYNAGEAADGYKSAKNIKCIEFDPGNINGINMKQANFKCMINVFNSLDKSLGKKVQTLFNLSDADLDNPENKPAEQKNTNAIEMPNLNQQQQNQPANGGVNVQQPAPQQNQPQGGNEEVSAPDAEYPVIPVNMTKIGEIDSLLNETFKVSYESSNKKLDKKSADFKNANNAIIAIKNKVQCTSNHRAEFLVKVAEYLGINGIFVAHKKQVSKYDKKNKKYTNLKITSILDGIEKLPMKYKDAYLKNAAVLLIRRIRNIIAIGLDMGTLSNDMPKKEMK